MRTIPAVLATLVLAAPTGACFHYVPAVEVPEQGAAVRAHLNRPVPVELPEITANNVVEVRGEFVSARPDQLILSAFALESAGALEHRAGGATVILPREAVGLLEERRLSPGRTALAAVALAGAGYLLQLGLRGGTSGSEGDGGPGSGK